MSNLRRLSRSAHPEAWEKVKRFRRLRRLSQQAMRAQERGDTETMLRLTKILRSAFGDEVFDGSLREQADEPTVVQKGDT